MFDIARILDERNGRFLVEWVNYDTPTWEETNAIYDEKGRCLCPKVLEEWHAFQASLVSSTEGPVPCRISIPATERHEVTEDQLATHGAFLHPVSLKRPRS